MMMRHCTWIHGALPKVHVLGGDSVSVVCVVEHEEVVVFLDADTARTLLADLAAAVRGMAAPTEAGDGAA